jgi:hypothetical protein
MWLNLTLGDAGTSCLISFVSSSTGLRLERSWGGARVRGGGEDPAVVHDQGP